MRLRPPNVLLRIGGGDGLAQPKFSSFGVDDQDQFIVDAGSNTSNTLNSGYHGYNNGEDLVWSDMTTQMELNVENLCNKNCKVIDEGFGITYAPTAIKQDHVLQSQIFVKNYGELLSILQIGSEGCTPEDCPELPNNMENNKREDISTSTKQNLVVNFPPTNGSPGVLSKEERRRLSNREAQRRRRANLKIHVNELEAKAKLFNNEVKPSLRDIVIAADTETIVYKVSLLRKHLNNLIATPQNAEIFGVSASSGFDHTSQVARSKLKRNPSIMRVDSCERLQKMQSRM